MNGSLLQSLGSKLRNGLPKWAFWIVVILYVAIFNDFARTGLPEAKRMGHHADMAIMLFLLSAILLFYLLPKWYARGFIAITVFWLTVFTIVNWWFFGFYRDYLTPSTLKLAVYAEESMLAWGGLGFKAEALWFLIAMFIGSLILFRLDRYKPSKRSLFIVAMVIMSLGGYKQHQADSRALGGLRHNGINHISYFVQNFRPAESLTFDAQNLEQIKSIYPYKQFAGDLEYPLFQNVSQSVQPRKPRNVLLIVLESIRAAETGFNTSAQPSLTPNLDAIASESLSFPIAYSNANQTVRSEISILCSALDFINGAPYSHLGEPINTACMPSILAEYGYETYWIHGYKKSFFNRENFFPSLGFQHISDLAVIAEAGYTDQIGWGISDEDLFKYTLETLEKSSKPFFAEVLTLSNHYPYLWDWNIEFPDNLQLPANIGDDTEVVYPAYRRGIYYTDYQLGKFWQAFKKSSIYDDTLVIVTGDHGIWTFDSEILQQQGFATEMHKNEIYFRTPLIFHAPDIGIEKNQQAVSHADILPTTLEYLGIDYPNAFIGTSVFNRKDYTYPVYFIASGGFGVRKNDTYCYPVDTTDMCQSYNRKCKDYELSGTATQCISTDQDLLHGVESFELVDHDLSNDQLLIRLTQHALNNRFMPADLETK